MVFTFAEQVLCLQGSNRGKDATALGTGVMNIADNPEGCPLLLLPPLLRSLLNFSAQFT